MNKNEQMQVNADIIKSIELINEEITQNGDYVSRLRRHAWVYETRNWYILKLYNTKIAAIHKSTGVCIDFCDEVTTTHPQAHSTFQKFTHDYGARKVLRYYDV